MATASHGSSMRFGTLSAQAGSMGEGNGQAEGLACPMPEGWDL